MLRAAERLCSRAASVLAAVGLTVLILFAAATLLDGLLRSLFGAPITAVGDVGTFVVAAAVSACFPLAQLQRANITIELLGVAAGPRMTQRLRAFSAVVVLVVLAAAAWQMFLYADNVATGGDTTVMLSIPTSPFWYVVAAMLACATVTQLLVAAVELGRLHRGEAPPLLPGMH